MFTTRPERCASVDRYSMEKVYGKQTTTVVELQRRVVELRRRVVELRRTKSRVKVMWEVEMRTE